MGLEFIRDLLKHQRDEPSVKLYKYSMEKKIKNVKILKGKDDGLKNGVDIVDSVLLHSQHNLWSSQFVKAMVIEDAQRLDENKNIFFIYCHSVLNVM